MRRRAWLFLLLLLGLAGCGGGDGVVPSAEPGSAVDALEVERLPIALALWGVAIDGDAIWVSDPTSATVIELDAGGIPVRTLPTGATDPRDAGLTVDDAGRLWVANLGGSVGVLDTVSSAVEVRVPIGPGEPASVAIAGGGAWVSRHGPGGGLTRLRLDDPAEGEDVAMPFDGFAVASDGAAAWVTGLDAGIVRVASTGEVDLEVDLPGAPRGVVLSGREVWVTLVDRGEVVRVDAASGEVTARVDVGGSPWPIAAGDGAVWVATLEGRLVRIDPTTASITAAGDVPSQARGLAVGAGAVWVTSQTGVLSRVALG